MTAKTPKTPIIQRLLDSANRLQWHALMLLTRHQPERLTQTSSWVQLGHMLKIFATKLAIIMA